MRNPTSARGGGVGAAVIGTAVLAFAGCGGSSGTSTSRPAAGSTAAPSAIRSTTSSPVGARSTTATSTTPATTTALGGIAKFNAEAAPLVGGYIAADMTYVAACCTGTNYGAEASAVRMYQAANQAFTQGLARLTPPPSAAVAIQNYIASVHADLRNSEEVLGALLARDRAGVHAAVRAYDIAGDATIFNTLLVALGVHGSDVVGYWDGFVTQHGPGATTPNYFTEMTVTASTPGEIAGTIDYPSLHCGGRLRLDSAQGILHIYQEQITSGRTRCGSGGKIYATVMGGAMSWRWVAGGVAVVGELDHLQRPGR